MEFVELAVDAACGHTMVAWFRKTMGVRAGISAVADTYSDLSAGFIYWKNGDPIINELMNHIDFDEV